MQTMNRFEEELMNADLGLTMSEMGIEGGKIQEGGIFTGFAESSKFGERAKVL